MLNNNLVGMLTMNIKEGNLNLADGTKLKLKLAIFDAREAGFSPYGGVNILVNSACGIKVESIPEKLKEAVANKPAASAEIQDGWELIDIASFEPAVGELDVNTSKGVFRVRVEAEPVMAARNMNYKVLPGLNEPLYSVRWVYKITWKPLKEE